MNTRRLRVITLLLSGLLIPFSAPPAVAQGQFSHEQLVGGWQANKPRVVYDISQGKQNQIIAEYGYEGQEHAVGHCQGTFDGKFLRGTWKTEKEEGALVLELVNPDMSLCTWWKDMDTSKSFGGRYYLHRLHTNDTRRQRLQKAEAGRWETVEKAAAEAMQQKFTEEQWIAKGVEVQQQIEQNGWWHKAWWLPDSIRNAPMSSWSAGHIENAFLFIAQAKAKRDEQKPEPSTTNISFLDPQGQPLAQNPRPQTNHEKASQRILRGRPFAQASLGGSSSYTKVYYGTWDYLTSHQAHGVIARPIYQVPEPLSVMLYNANQHAVSGRYNVRVSDGKRLLQKATGTIRLSPDTEKQIPLENVSAFYCFTWPHVELQFIPDDYELLPIPKDQVEPFHETYQQYESLSESTSPELDFVDAMLWARVKQAWEADDLKRYARAVRDAGGRLYYASNQAPEVKAYVRQHLEPLERLAGYFGTSVPSDAKVGITPLKVALKHERTNSSRERDRGPRPDGIVDVEVGFKHGQFLLGKGGMRVTMAGAMELFDGPVLIGAYSLTGVIGFGDSKRTIASPSRTVSFYQDTPAYRIDLTFSGWEKPARGGSMSYNFSGQMNSVVPGWRSALSPSDPGYAP